MDWIPHSAPRVDRLQIGSGLDIGYIRGFYGPETGKDGVRARLTGGPPATPKYAMSRPPPKLYHSCGTPGGPLVPRPRGFSW